MNQRTYVGSGWQKKFDNGGSVISVSVNLQKLSAIPVDNYGNVRIVVGERRAVDEKSKATHWVAVDDYYYSRNAPAGQQREEREIPPPDDLNAPPF